MTRPVRRSVGQLVCLNVLKGREVTPSCSYRSTCQIDRQIYRQKIVILQKILYILYLNCRVCCSCTVPTWEPTGTCAAQTVSSRRAGRSRWRTLASTKLEIVQVSDGSSTAPSTISKEIFSQMSLCYLLIDVYHLRKSPFH